MEYIEYYRIIRERIWLVLLTGALAALAIIAMRLMPGLQEETWTANGRMEVLEVAKREIDLEGPQLSVGLPRDARLFWANFAALASSRHLLLDVLRDLDMAPDAADQYDLSVRAGQLEGSNYLMVRCTSTEEDLSPTVLDSAMERIAKYWYEYRVEQAQRVVNALEDRGQRLQRELQAAQQAVTDFEAAHGGLSPTEDMATTTSSLRATEVALQSADLELAAARERREAIGALTQPIQPGEQAALGFSERIDALQAQIMERETALADMLTSRTESHPAVATTRQQIETLRSRVAQLEDMEKRARAQVAAPGEAVAAAQVYAAEMSKRREVLAARVAELRDRLTRIQTEAARYAVLRTDVEAAKQRYEQLEQYLSVAKAELENRKRNTDMLRIVDGAKIEEKPRGLVAFIMKLAMATFAGIGVGILVIFVLYYVDTTFKNEQEAARLLGCPILAGIPHTDIEVVVEEAPPEGAPGPAPPG